MPVLGKLLKKGLQLRQSVEQHFATPFDLQKEQLRHLLITARQTDFGKHYQFSKILDAFRSNDTDAFYGAFKEQVPVHDYNKIYHEWWYRLRNGEANICWPGKVNYFALSSGTSEAASKHIPITGDMLKSVQRVGVRQILSLCQYDLPASLFEKGILMLGGSTNLVKGDFYFEGDLSGITTRNVPYWFHSFYKPGRKIAREKDWDRKLDEITKQAHKWDIGVIVGVPAWLQLLLEKIVRHYQLNTIHDLWPNLTIFAHGGVAMMPYFKSFERLCATPLTYIETYLASEGFIAFQDLPHTKAMQLVLNSGIFMEFVPFNEQNFTASGELQPNPEICMVHDVEEGKDYALLLSSCAGAWRYLIGDVIRFTDKEAGRIIITGRTKHFLSLCGEHLSVDNMNQGVTLLANELGLEINEYTVAGKSDDGQFGHQWYIGTDTTLSPEMIRDKLDAHLQALNDDYRTERAHALQEIEVVLLPVQAFYQWMQLQGKVGGQHKVPRVMKGKSLESWEAFLASSFNSK